MNDFSTIKIISIFFAVLCLLSGCSNTPLKAEYYTLHYPLKADSRNEQPKKFVLVESIVLADYLRQQGLVMQSSKNKIQFSEQHRWADKLDESILRVILANLENQRKDFRFESFKGRWKSEPEYRLNLEISHFHVVDNNHTIVAGQFWLFDGQKQLLTKQRFDIKSPLSGDGYLNAVEQMNNALVSLAAVITKTLE